MLVSVTAKRQVTFPVKVLAALGAAPGDRIELLPSADGYLLRARRVDVSKLAPLRAKLKSAKPFDIHAFREAPRAPSLRD